MRRPSAAVFTLILAGASGCGRVEMDVVESGPWLTGYYVGWQAAAYPPDKVAMAALTHIVFGAVEPGADGGVAFSVGDDNGTCGPLVERAHAANRSALLLLAGDRAPFAASTSDAAHRSALASNLLAIIAQYGFDGAAVHWAGGFGDASQVEQLIAFLAELREAAGLQARFRPPHRAFLLAFLAPYHNANDPAPAAANGRIAALVDQFNVATFGMAGAFGGWSSWHFSALSGAQDDRPTSIEETVAAYLAAGVPRAKLGLGLGLYGVFYGASVTGPGQSLAIDAWAVFDESQTNYAQLLRDGAFSQGEQQWDELAKQSYRRYQPAWNRRGTQIGYLSYEDEASIAAKGAWAREQGLGGAAVWTLAYGCTDAATGRNPLLEAARKAFRP